MAKLSNLVGQKFSDLTVIERTSMRNRGDAIYRCLCLCGKETLVPTNALNSGNTKSCGCRRSRVQIKHNLSRHYLYSTWSHMIQRCSDPDHIQFIDYGARGIVVCKEWLQPNGLTQFISDMGDRPKGKYSLDRIDNNKGYSKENCRWATNTEQQCNTRQNNKLTFNGETLCIAEWSRRIGVRPDTLWRRFKKGWPVDKILFKGHFSTRTVNKL